MWEYFVSVALGIVILSFVFLKTKRTTTPQTTIVPLPVQTQSPKPVSKVTSTKKEKTVGQKKTGLQMSLFYYSQTGTAEEYCYRIEREAKNLGFETSVHDVDEYDRDQLCDESFIVFCAATYGEGDPPDNATEFHDWITSDERPDDFLNGVKFSVFGLGNSSYPHYNKVARVLDKRFHQLGAKRVGVRGEGDDDKQLEEDFTKWRESWWNEVCKEFNIDKTNQADNDKKPDRRTRMSVFTVDDPAITKLDMDKLRGSKAYEGREIYWGKVLVNKELHSPTSTRSCRHLEIEIGKLTYEPGDHVGIFPENNETLVHKLAARLNADLNQVIALYPVEGNLKLVPILGPCTLKRALLSYFDILSNPSKSVLRVLSYYTEDLEQKQKLEDLSSEDPTKALYYNEYIVTDQRTLFEVLKAFTSCKPDLSHLLEVLPRLSHRLYSISSSPKVHPGQVHVTAIVTKFMTRLKREHLGVCSTWLADEKRIPSESQSPVVPLFLRRSEFSMPSNPRSPIIMVGPGTGLAPFRGFIEHLSFLKSEGKEIGPAVLFFGCRNPQEDYIYQAELENYHKQGILSELHTAFSRVTSTDKTYVQDLMKKPEVAKKLFDLLSKDGYFYVCGDAGAMAKDVQETLLNIVASEGAMNLEDASAFLKSLQSSKRYLLDIWS
eukprot:TRINITY_DN1999_c0_g1_i1.p1 TRINITY_DN1999_c0_g1~~TRINITY_DN1999_c0_g1_i1.p1  ORF type:complete len:662 (+),score=128.62 TRINITY_DN1999_c0_g1_i1:124-2109(+)